MKNKVLLIDLPTFPKGVLSLSLLTVAGVLQPYFKCEYFDLNFEEDRKRLLQHDLENIALVGIKVSSQSFSHAIEITQFIKQKRAEATVLWGGELPTLIKEECLAYANLIVSGLFESVANELIQDLHNNRLKQVYVGNNRPENGFGIPDFSIIHSPNRYNSFMGYPLESSRGCNQHCVFCMVLVMQAKNYYVKAPSQLEQDLKAIGHRFLNVVDYNVGVSKQHALLLAALIKQSEVLGWMAEMNIEILDDDKLLQALKQSRCRMIYCGLESIDEQALHSVNKDKTNKVYNYERIIRKVQSYGIDIAAGLILGLDNADWASYKRTLAFYDKMGIIYTKFTFLVYNPGTRVKEYMARHGQYVTNTVDKYDGLQVSFLPAGQNELDLYNHAEELMKSYYSPSAVWRRSGHIKYSLSRRFEHFLFSICYGQVYTDWCKTRGQSGYPNISSLVNKTYTKNWRIVIAEKLLHIVRKINYRDA
jgi:radical SAM superfamily enzyme YgiQ (UPF0313 family)